MGKGKNKRAEVNWIVRILLVLCTTSSIFAGKLGSITSLVEENSEFIIRTSDGAKTKVIFYRDDIFRIWVGPNGTLTDPAGDEETPIVVYDGDPITVSLTDEGSYYKIESESCVLRIQKSLCTFSLYKKDNTTLLFEETSPIELSYYNSYQQTRKLNEDYFYGCGMQNGHFCHNDRTLKIENVYDDAIWEEHGTPNAAPFYMSLNGYGVFRNTYEAGSYDFKNTVATSHEENRFDAYYFVGDLKEMLEGYTLITGRPFLTPRWGLEFGDADRYNQGSYESVKYADMYIDKDLPLGWVLPNDGYGMDFSRIPEVSRELTKRNIITGMWTDKGLNFDSYVSQHAIRLFKLDIAWVGVGTKFSMNACREVYGKIESNSDARGMIWTTLGWAGNHRYSIMWTGDNGQKAHDDFIRWHIPTVSGSGLSAQNGATGDIDGIWGGTGDRYVRDLQWKCFTPNMMVIDNWKVVGQKWKKPWNYGDYYTNHNRKSLKLKSRLIPYLYTYSYEAHMTGVPMARAFVLEFPEDSKTWTEEGETKHQFMCGESFLIAPVYEKASTTSWSFYLPKGKWTDFQNGDVYEGGQRVTGFDVSDYKMPIMVKEGAIIPMYPESYYENRKQLKPQDPLTVDVYPSLNKKSSFTLFEDDGLTYKFRDGKFNKTKFECIPSGGEYTIATTGGYEGSGYDGMLQKRNYIYTIHSAQKTDSVWLKLSDGTTKKLEEKQDSTSLFSSTEGWWYSSAKSGIIYIKLAPLDWNEEFQLGINKLATSTVNGKLQNNTMNNLQITAQNGTITYQLDCSEAGNAQVKVFDLQGKEIFSTFLHMKEGRNTATALIGTPGMYIFKVLQGDLSLVKKIVVK